MREKSLPDIVFNRHLLHPLSLGDSYNIQNIGRCNKPTVNPVGKKNYVRILDCLLYLTKDLTHIHFYDNYVIRRGTALPDKPGRKRPKGL